MTFLAVVALIALLILLISWGRAPPLLAFLVVSLVGGLWLGMPLADIPKAMERGVGDMLAAVTAILCLGAMFGRLIADHGAAEAIARSLISAVGVRFIVFAMALTGLIVGIPLFYTVGFVVMTPLIHSLARRAGLPSIYVGIPLLCGLSVAHGFLPPHPSPLALVEVFEADLGLTLLYGLAVSAVALLVAGPLLALALRGFADRLPAAPSAASAGAEATHPGLPGVANSFTTALLPVAMIAAATALAYGPQLPPGWAAFVAFAGQPAVVLTLSLAYATLSLGLLRGVPFTGVMQRCAEALRDVAGVLLILAGAGALKQVFLDGGVSEALAGWLRTAAVDPLVLGWGIAVVVRVAVGSATLAGVTAAGLMAPVVASAGVDPNMMVLAVGAGSLMLSHVNDPGFWLFKEYFGLSLKDTFRTWTVMESLAGLVGLLAVLALNLALHPPP